MESKIFLGKYRVLAEKIEAVGEVADSSLAYEAEEIDSSKKVVVEVVPAASLNAAARERLKAQAMTAKALNHVNIAALYDFGVQDDHLVYVTEDLEGTTAEEWINANGPMPVGPVLRIASQVVSALSAAAFHEIVHRAINPSHLVLVPGQTAQGEWPLVKVLHFVGGAPKIPGSEITVTAFDKSTHYTSPEQRERGTVDFRSEIYSLGCTMWFLLYGMPPLMTPNGPGPTPPKKTGLAGEARTALPKKVDDLLAQMLSTNPEARPPDPLAFYRMLQDCLAQPEGGETMARKLVSTRAVDPPGRRRRPVKALALAAVLLASAALAALVVTGYLRHRRVVHSEEPIGAPIGVPDAVAPAAPVTSDAATAMMSNAAQPTAAAVADSNSTQSEPPVSSGNSSGPLVATDSVEDASTNQLVVARVQPTTPDSAVNPPTQDPALDPASNATTLLLVPDSPEVASTSRVETAPTPARSTDGEVREIDQLNAPKKIIMPEVRRAEPADEPEVRRAELARSDEGPTEVKPDRIRSPRQQTNSVPTTEPSRDVEAEATKTPSLVLKRTDSSAKPKRRTDEKIYLLPGHEFEPPPLGRLPRGSVRGRFVGVTADGRWMFELPSREIVTVLPPESR